MKILIIPTLLLLSLSCFSQVDSVELELRKEIERLKSQLEQSEIETIDQVREKYISNSKPYRLLVCKNSSSKKDVILPTKNLSFYENARKRGFRIEDIWYENEGTLSYGGFLVNSFGIGSCVDESSITFLFEDGSKISFPQAIYNYKLCVNDNGEVSQPFDLEGTFLNMQKVQQQKVTFIRFDNGYNLETILVEVDIDLQRTFIEAGKALKTNDIIYTNWCNRY